MCDTECAYCRGETKLDSTRAGRTPSGTLITYRVCDSCGQSSEVIEGRLVYWEQRQYVAAFPLRGPSDKESIDWAYFLSDNESLWDCYR